MIFGNRTVEESTVEGYIKILKCILDYELELCKLVINN